MRGLAGLAVSRRWTSERLAEALGAGPTILARAVGTNEFLTISSAVIVEKMRRRESAQIVWIARHGMKTIGSRSLLTLVTAPPIGVRIASTHDDRTSKAYARRGSSNADYRIVTHQH